MVGRYKNERNKKDTLSNKSAFLSFFNSLDLDFGLDNYLELVKQTTFPWLLSNVFDKTTGEPYANSPTTHTMDFKGRKLGFVGLVESDWLSTLGAVDPETIEHRDMATVGDELAKKLRGEGCEFIIAITHSRLPNDELLATQCPQLDMIFGGHDHDYVTKQMPNGVWVVKSGTDFRALTEIRASFPEPLSGDAALQDGVFRPYPLGTVKITTTKHDIVASLPEDPAMKAILAEYLDSREKAMQVPIGFCEVPLDARFSVVRTRESNAGNLVADLLRKSLHGDCALINGGTLRADRIQGPGEYKVKDLVDLLPMPTQCVLLEIPGELFPSILENAVAKYPVLEGRFGQVSGMKYKFDPEQPAGSRIVPGSIEVCGKPLNNAQRYKFVTTEYLAGGKDGYTAFADPSVKMLVDAEEGPCIPTVLRNHFRLVNVAQKILKASSSNKAGMFGANAKNKFLALSKSKKTVSTDGSDSPASPSVEDGEQETLDIPTIAPKVEGRIINIREKVDEPAPVPAPVPTPAAVSVSGAGATPSAPKDLSLVFVLGAPGSGKGTNCERIAKEFGYKHLSTGDLLRDEVKSGSELGAKLNTIMQSGELVPGEIVLKILRNAMTEGGTKPISGRFLIDGYPRAPDQVTAFEAAICKPTFVLAFDAAEAVLEERLVNRGKTSGRADDNVESIRKRFATFKAQSEPVITTYGAQGLVKSLNSERPVNEVYAEVRPIFMDELRRMSGPAVPTPAGLSLVFVLGGPGSGKGTNCERIAKDFSYKHLSSGDLLRDEVKSGSELGKQLNAIMQTGALVPGEIVLKILRNAMTEGGTKPISGRFLIDGYPRALDQVVAFEAAICKPSFVLAFDAAEAVLEERLVNRGKTSGRADDNVESIRKRFATFKAQSEPVIEVYNKEGLVKSLNSERPVDEVYADVRPIFEAETKKSVVQTESGGLVLKPGAAGAKTSASAQAPSTHAPSAHSSSAESAPSTQASTVPTTGSTAATAAPVEAKGCCTVS
jgi:adenylate kinase family enzyme/2',3'-cyclic-nucleotide 2'-phosphodiesterase (5'-nucleotidase family)